MHETINSCEFCGFNYSRIGGVRFTKPDIVAHRRCKNNRLLRHVGKTLAGGGDESLLGVASKGLDMLGPMIAAQASAPKPAPVAPAPAPRQVIQQPPAPTPVPEDPMLQQLFWLRNQVGALIRQAAKGGDPALYADVFMDNLPDFLTPEAVFEQMTAPDAVTRLVQLDSRVQHYLPWFEKFREAVLAQFEDDEPAASAPSAPSEPAGGLTE